MKRAKTVYYQARIKEFSLAKDMKKTWSLINTLLGKDGKSSSIAEIKINGIIYNDRKQIAEHLNDYFVNIGPTPLLNVNVFRIMKTCIVIELV